MDHPQSDQAAGHHQRAAECKSECETACTGRVLEQRAIAGAQRFDALTCSGRFTLIAPVTCGGYLLAGGGKANFEFGHRAKIMH